MNKERYIFSQITDFISCYEFNNFIQKYDGDKLVRRLSCRDQFLSLMFGQLTGLQSLRGIVLCLNAHKYQLYHLGFRSKKFTTIKNETNIHKKGKVFEEFLKQFFNKIDGLEIVNIKQASDQQIDFVIKNNINRPFWINLRSPLFVGEAKNWSKKTSTKEIAILKSKMEDHTNLSSLGIFVAMNGFSEQEKEIQKRTGNGKKLS